MKYVIFLHVFYDVFHEVCNTIDYIRSHYSCGSDKYIMCDLKLQSYILALATVLKLHKVLVQN